MATAWQHSTSAHKDCECRAWKELGITGMPEVSQSYIQNVQSLRVHFRHCIWKSHLLWPPGSSSCVLCLQKGLVQGDFHLDPLKPQDLWVELCRKVKLYQLIADSGHLLNMQLNNLDVGGRDWKCVEDSLWSMGHSG